MGYTNYDSPTRARPEPSLPEGHGRQTPQPKLGPVFRQEQVGMAVGQATRVSATMGANAGSQG